MNRSKLKLLLPGFIRPRALALWRYLYWWQRRRIPRRANQRRIRAALASGRPIKLELASPIRIGREDWLFSDLGGNGDLQLDLTQPLPFPDCSVDTLYCSHFLEHLSYPSPMMEFLKECVRVLKPGGTLSVAVPDARIFLSAYFDDEPLDAAAFLAWPVGLRFKSRIDYLNFVAYLGGEHKHMFDESALVHVLEESGLREVESRQFDADLDLASRRHESIYAVGMK